MRDDMGDWRPLPIVIAGHVDHGKSTLVGRLLHDTGALDDGRVKELQAVSARRGLAFEWSFLLDALQVERDQGITVDTTQTWFRTAKRRYAIIDAPGHLEFLKNMLSGAAAADGAVLVVDVVAGLSEQTRRHAYLLQLLGVDQLIVAVNKMDLVGYDQARFRVVAEAVERYLGDIGLTPASVIPIAAKSGDNIVTPSLAMPWYEGESLTAALDALPPRPLPVEAPFRLPVQDVYRLGDKRVVVGRIESGRLRLGDELAFHPGGFTARVASLEGRRREASASAGESVAFTLDRELFIERGHLAAAPEHPPLLAHRVAARVVWLDAAPLAPGRNLRLRSGTAERAVRVAAIERQVDLDRLDALAAERVERNAVADIVLEAAEPLPVDAHRLLPRTGRGVLVDGHRVVGGCVFEAAAEAAAAAPQTVSRHRGGVLWLTGLSGSGKSTLANALAAELKLADWQVALLDGDEVRRRLNSDLGFSPQDRAENIRRVAEVARLLSEAGLLVVVALISPMVADRRRARRILGGRFRLVYVKADPALCQARDPKGLYARALNGEIAQFTGVSAPYEAPTAADLVIDTASATVERSVRSLRALAEQAFGIGAA